jgi:hypothetical protein
MLISLFILGVGQYLYTKHIVKNTLIDRLGRLEYVDKVEIRRDEDKFVVYVKLKSIDDFKEAYTNVNDTIRGSLGKRKYEIVIRNNPDKLIKKIYNERIQFIIYEAVQTGKYDEMRERLDSIKSNLPIKINVFIDKTNLYLQLLHDKHSLYNVVKLTD